MKKSTEIIVSVLCMIVIFLTALAVVIYRKADAPLACDPAQRVDRGCRDVYYVSSIHPNRSDSNNGRSSETPWETLAKASEVKLGPYDELLIEQGSHFLHERLVVQAEGHYTYAPAAVDTYASEYGQQQGLAGKKPSIENPPDDPDYYVEWEALNEAYRDKEPPRSHVKIAVKLQGFETEKPARALAISGLEIMHTEMGIVGNVQGGWFEDLYIHNLGYDDNGNRLPREQGGHLLMLPYQRFQEDCEGGACSMWPGEYAAFGGYPNPQWGGGIVINSGTKISMNNIVMEKVVDGIIGYVADAKIENVFIDKATVGGFGGLGGNGVEVKNVTVLNAGWPTGKSFYGHVYPWFGICIFMPTVSSNFRVTDSDFSHILAVGDGCVADPDYHNQGIHFERIFAWNNSGAPWEFGMGGPNRDIHVKDTVNYSNGLGLYPAGEAGIAFSADACSYGSRNARVENNLVFKTIPQQSTNYYFLAPKEGQRANHFDYATQTCGYTTQNNQIFEAGTYTLPLPIPTPPPIDQEKIPFRAVHVSSGEETTSFAHDGVLTTDWISHELDKEPWIQVEFDQPYDIDTVRLFDRANLDNWITSAELIFSDGSTILVTGGIQNNGAVREVKFEPKKGIQWMKLRVTRTVPEASGKNPGVAEIEVYKTKTEEKLSIENKSLSGFPGNVVTLDFSERPAEATPLQGIYRDVLDVGDAGWKTRQDPLTGQHYAYIDFPRLMDSQGNENQCDPSNADTGCQDFGGPTWLARYLKLVPWGSTITGLTFSCPPGTVVSFEQRGQESLTPDSTTLCTGQPQTIQTGWSVKEDVAPGIHSPHIDDLIAIGIEIGSARNNLSAENQSIPANVNDIHIYTIEVELPVSKAKSQNKKEVFQSIKESIGSIIKSVSPAQLEHK